MPARGRSGWRALPAWAVVVSVLAVATAAVIPGHWHGGMQGQSCNVCRSGHLPAPAALAPAEIHPPAPVEWTPRGAESGAAAAPALASSSTRAPPA